MALVIDIADAVVSELNSPALGMPFTAMRAYVPRFDLEEMGTPRVTVVPKGVDISTACRSGHQHDYRVDIGVQRKFGEEGAAELDPLMDLVEEVADHFRGSALETDPEAPLRGGRERADMRPGTHARVSDLTVFSRNDTNTKLRLASRRQPPCEKRRSE